jgi:hypothetical protein
MTRRKVRALAEELRERLDEGGPRLAAELCCEIERQHGRPKLDQVLDEFMVLYHDEREAHEAAKLTVH